MIDTKNFLNGFKEYILKQIRSVPPESKTYADRHCFNSKFIGKCDFSSQIWFPINLVMITRVEFSTFAQVM